MEKQRKLALSLIFVLIALPAVTLAQANIHGVLYVGGTITAWGTGDIGSQINNAYAALPATGGTISLVPQASGACYNFSTPIQFATVGKYAILQGLAPSTSTNSNPGGACLNFTPTSVVSAIVIDWTPSDGGGNAPGAGLRDITLVNSIPGQFGVACSSQGGCGSQAQGIQLGGTNGGMGDGLFSNVKVQGFQSGYKIEDGIGTNPPSGNGWGITWFHCMTVWNAIGLNYVVPHELDQYMGGSLNNNWEAVALSYWGAELAIIGSSLAANSGCYVQMTDGTILHLTDVHFENTTGGDTCYVSGGSTLSSTVDISGGIAYDDVGGTVTNSSTNWFTAGLISAKGLILFSNGRTTSTSVFVGNTYGSYDILNRNPSLLPNI
jgi:hypothetical protein